MAFFIVALVLLGTMALAPWLGTDSQGLDPVHFEPSHPLHGNSGANRG